MDLQLEGGTDILIDGPASFQMISGRAEVLGAILMEGRKVVVRRGKRLPMSVLEDSLIRLTIGDSGSYSKSKETIPHSWHEAVRTVIGGRRSPVMVIGPVDSGKSSLCTFLCNHAIREGMKVGVIDGDIGQSDIGPPGTMGLALIDEDIVDLYGAEPAELVFVGTKSPSTVTVRTFTASVILDRKARLTGVDLLIVNTDGWVNGEEALVHKRGLIEVFQPSTVIVMRKSGDMESLDVGRARKLIVESPRTIKERRVDTRRELRNLAYGKYLKGSKTRAFPLSSLETHDWVEAGVLVGLEGEEGELLGIGILLDVDEGGNLVKVHTPVRSSIRKVRLGRIRLEIGGEEVL